MLTNDAGEVTSHLTGMFYRTIKLFEVGIKPVYVFDGAGSCVPPQPPPPSVFAARLPTVPPRWGSDQTGCHFWLRTHAVCGARTPRPVQRRR